MHAIYYSVHFIWKVLAFIACRGTQDACHIMKKHSALWSFFPLDMQLIWSFVIGNFGGRSMLHFLGTWVDYFPYCVSVRMHIAQATFYLRCSLLHCRSHSRMIHAYVFGLCDDVTVGCIFYFSYGDVGWSRIGYVMLGTKIYTPLFPIRWSFMIFFEI